MSSAAQVVSEAFVGAGAAVAVLGAVALLRFRSTYRRLHYLAVVTSVAGPLVGIGAAVADGPGLATAMVLLIVLLLAVTGPVLVVAAGRLRHGSDP